MVSRTTRQVLGFVFGDRSDGMLGDAWADVRACWRGLPVRTDFFGAYARFFPKAQHTPCEKGRGQTSTVEALNTQVAATAVESGAPLVRRVRGH